MLATHTITRIVLPHRVSFSSLSSTDSKARPHTHYFLNSFALIARSNSVLTPHRRIYARSPLCCPRPRSSGNQLADHLHRLRHYWRQTRPRHALAGTRRRCASASASDFAVVYSSSNHPPLIEPRLFDNLSTISFSLLRNRKRARPSHPHLPPLAQNPRRHTLPSHPSHARHHPPPSLHCLLPSFQTTFSNLLFLCPSLAPRPSPLLLPLPSPLLPSTFSSPTFSARFLFPALRPILPFKILSFLTSSPPRHPPTSRPRMPSVWRS
jgi:hypothetical protein